MPCRSILISIDDADYLGLIDNVEYKYLSNIVRNNLLIAVEVVIEDIDERNHEGEEIMRATYTFDLKSDKEWVIQYNFTWTSCLGNKLNDILCDGDDDETEDAYTTEDTDDIYSSPTSPKSVIN